MSTQLYILLFALVVIFVITVIVSKKTKHFFACIFLSAVSGIGSLFAVNLLSEFTSVSIAQNYISLSLSAFMGTPGVIALLISQLILK